MSQDRRSTVVSWRNTNGAWFDFLDNTRYLHSYGKICSERHKFLAAHIKTKTKTQKKKKTPGCRRRLASAPRWIAWSVNAFTVEVGERIPAGSRLGRLESRASTVCILSVPYSCERESRGVRRKFARYATAVHDPFRIVSPVHHVALLKRLFFDEPEH